MKLFKGTGTRDFIWLKVVSLDRSSLVGLMDDLKKKHCSQFKGTGARDLIWLKVVSLDRSSLVGLTDDL